MKETRILVAVTGGISAYKSLDVISALKKMGYHVSAMATESALEFVTENALQVMAHKYWKHTWSAPIHINATDPNEIDAFVVVPATANIMAKIAWGLADDLVSSTVLALPSKTVKMICPSMNTRMWNNDIVQDNYDIIKNHGWHFLDPISGLLACGVEGVGKLPPTKDIVEFVRYNIEGLDIA